MAGLFLFRQIVDIGGLLPVDVRLCFMPLQTVSCVEPMICLPDAGG